MPAAPPRSSYANPNPPAASQPAFSYPPHSSSYAPYPSTDGPLGQHLATSTAASAAASDRDQGGTGAGGRSNMYPSAQGSASANQPGTAQGGNAGNAYPSTQGFASAAPQPGLAANGAGPQPTAPQMGQGEPVADSDPAGNWWNQLPSAPQPPPAAAQNQPGRSGSDASAGLKNPNFPSLILNDPSSLFSDLCRMHWLSQVQLAFSSLTNCYCLHPSQFQSCSEHVRLRGL